MVPYSWISKREILGSLIHRIVQPINWPEPSLVSISPDNHHLPPQIWLSYSWACPCFHAFVDNYPLCLDFPSFSQCLGSHNFTHLTWFISINPLSTILDSCIDFPKISTPKFEFLPLQTVLCTGHRNVVTYKHSYLQSRSRGSVERMTYFSFLQHLRPPLIFRDCWLWHWPHPSAAGNSGSSGLWTASLTLNTAGESQSHPLLLVVISTACRLSVLSQKAWGHRKGPMIWRHWFWYLIAG